EGYMEIGDVPTFKIYDASSGNIFDATPSVEVGSWSVNGFSMNDLLEASEVIIGCTDNTACNYDLNATEPCTDCCLYIEDCAGECGGSAEDLGCGCNIEGPSGCDNVCGSILENDTCGECGGDNSTCTGCMDELACNFDETIIIENNQECEYPQQNFDCEGNCTVFDCNNVCGGSSEIDECGVCDGIGADYLCDNGDLACNQDQCTGVGGCMEIDACNYNPEATFNNFSCEYPQDNFDCEGNCTVVVDCNNVCGGSGIVDACGICDGGSECSGQIVQGQCVNGEFNIGDFNVSGFDCSGWCLGTFSYSDDSCYDCEGTPDGGAWESDCGCIAADNTGDDCDDCDGIPNGDAIVDECGVCFGENDDMNEFGLSCLFGCTDENASNFYCDAYYCENGEPPGGFEDDGSCTYNVEGSVKYFNSDATPIEDVMIKLNTSVFGLNYLLDSTFTDGSGNFLFTDVSLQNSENESYEFYYFEYSSSESIDNSHIGINLSDADLISDVVVTLESFPYDNEITQNNISSIAADVDINGIVNAFDATRIRRFMSGTSSELNELNVRWRFISELDTIYNLTNLNGNENILIYGIKLGDPNGSWE
ncbi:MAG: hypothetical protein HOA66_02480, partial [Candidatus Marinimicrobia bacterium]|nr:hypothetical protein [Candidatus Neomarinimicrobiota bacterium]